MPTLRQIEHICAYHARVKWTRDEIKRRRNARGLDQETLGRLLAEALGDDKPVSRRAITNWENGHAEPRGRYVHALDKVLGTEPNAGDVTLSSATFMQLVAEITRRYAEAEAAAGRPQQPDLSLGEWEWRRSDMSAPRRRDQGPNPISEVAQSEQEM